MIKLIILLVVAIAAGIFYYRWRLRRYSSAQARRVRREPQFKEQEDVFTEELEVEQVQSVRESSVTAEVEYDALGLKVSSEQSVTSAQKFTEKAVAVSAQQAQESENKREIATDKQEMLFLFLRSESHHPFQGYELLQALLASGLRYGEMNVFHYYAQKNERKQVLFSLASAQEPGTFDLPNMGGFSCFGLCFFMRLNPNVDVNKAFDKMLELAAGLADDLGGQVLDEQQKPLTKEKMLELRQKVHQFSTSGAASDYSFDSQDA